jgi:hypothetical protein
VPIRTIIRKKRNPFVDKEFRLEREGKRLQKNRERKRGQIEIHD